MFTEHDSIAAATKGEKNDDGEAPRSKSMMTRVPNEHSKETKEECIRAPSDETGHPWIRCCQFKWKVPASSIIGKQRARKRQPLIKSAILSE